jgi:phage terminase small subunit|tara:strand:- start:43 stop:492 length:450 start_codon:yes stop_codon:yes gene_type:complete
MNKKISNISGLTSKQEKFAQGVISGKNASESYRDAYNTKGMKDSSVWTESSKLMSNPKVAQRIQQGIKRKNEYAVTSAISIRQMIIDRLQKEALDMKNNESARIRALEMLGKVSEIALFTERVETVNQNKTSEEIRAELEDKIQQMFGS